MKKLRALDDKVTKLDKDVYALEQLVVHVKGDVYWVKKHLDDNAESESESEKEENKEKEDSETKSEEAVDKPN